MESRVSRMGRSLGLSPTTLFKEGVQRAKVGANARPEM